MKKPPEVDDVYELLSKRSARWNDFARALKIDANFREKLQRHGFATTEETKLESILYKWIESEPSDVTWSNLIKVLERLQFLDIASEVKGYLKNEEVIKKYRQKKDYTGQLFQMNNVWYIISILLVYYYKVSVLLVY